MGIQGLLGRLKKIAKPVHVKDYANERVGIDAYCWLHRGAYGCSWELATGAPTDKYVRYCMDRIRCLIHWKVVPVVVFDGGYLPSKAGTEKERRASREARRAQGFQYMRNNESERARDCFQKCIDITPEMARHLQDALEAAGVEFVVAPYEADAQLAFMAYSGDVAAVITEDSDLVAYHAPRVIYKMDKFGNGQEIQYARLTAVPKMNFTSFTTDMFLYMCILAGCDFLPSLKGMGIVKAFAVVRASRTFEGIVRSLRLNNKFGSQVTDEYVEGFRRAVLTFKHQRVYDSKTRAVVPLTPLPDTVTDDDVPFIGAPIDAESAVAIATGLVDPISRQPFANGANRRRNASLLRTRSLPAPVETYNPEMRPPDVADIASYFTKAPSAGDDGAASRKRLVGSEDEHNPPTKRPKHGAASAVVRSQPSTQAATHGRPAPRRVVKSKYFAGTAGTAGGPGARTARGIVRAMSSVPSVLAAARPRVPERSPVRSGAPRPIDCPLPGAQLADPAMPLDLNPGGGTVSPSHLTCDSTVIDLTADDIRTTPDEAVGTPFRPISPALAAGAPDAITPSPSTPATSRHWSNGGRSAAMLTPIAFGSAGDATTPTSTPTSTPGSVRASPSVLHQARASVALKSSSSKARRRRTSAKKRHPQRRIGQMASARLDRRPTLTIASGDPGKEEGENATPPSLKSTKSAPTPALSSLQAFAFQG